MNDCSMDMTVLVTRSYNSPIRKSGIHQNRILGISKTHTQFSVRKIYYFLHTEFYATFFVKPMLHEKSRFARQKKPDFSGFFDGYNPI